MLRQKYITLISLLLIVVLYLWGHNTEASFILVDGSPRTILQHGIFITASIGFDLGLVFVLMTFAGGIGRFSLSVMSWDDISIGERVAIDCMIGLGIISLIALTLGLIGQYNPIIWGVVIILGLVSGGYVLKWLGDVSKLIFGSGRRETPWERFVKAYVMVALIAGFLLAVAPPFAWDSINYHLVVPERYIETGVIGQHLDNHFFGFPQNIEMLYGLLMMIGTDRMPAILHFMVGILGLIAVYNVVQRHSSSKSASVAVLVLMMSFNLWMLFGWAYVDLTLMTYGAIAIITITQWSKAEENPHHWLALTAIIASLGAGVKYTVAPLIIGLYLVIILRDREHLIRNTLIFGGFGILLFAGWMTKGILLYENPFYPYIFDGAGWDSTRSINFGETGKGLLANNDWLQIIFLPFTATIFGVDKVTPYRFVTGPFLLTMPFILSIGWQKLPDQAKYLARQVVPMALITWIFWVVVASISGIGGQTRLMLVGAPMVAILSGLAYHSIEIWRRRPIDMVFIVQATMIVALFFTSFEFINYFSRTRVLEYHTGAISEDDYLLQNMGILYGAMLALDDLPENSRVLFLWEPKTYYCPDDLICNGDLLFDNWARPIEMGLSPEEVIAQWQTEYDYLLLFDINLGETVDGYSLWLTEHDFSRERNELFPDYFFDAVEPVWSDGVGYTIYTWSE